MENPIKIDDLGVPLFLETPICFWKGSTTGMTQVTVINPAAAQQSNAILEITIAQIFQAKKYPPWN